MPGAMAIFFCLNIRPKVVIEIDSRTGVLNTGMVMVACLYIFVGFFGYLRYGDEESTKQFFSKYFLSFIFFEYAITMQIKS
jgi:amino acid permease